MPRRSLEIQGRLFLIAPDDPVPLGERHQALLQARVIDEMTGRPPRVPITLHLAAPQVAPRVAGDGFVGLAGVPLAAFRPRAADGFPLPFVIRAEGYLPLHVNDGHPDDRRQIVAPAAAAGDTVLTLNNASRLQPGESLWIGPPGPAMLPVQIRALGPGANQVTISAERSTGQPGLPRGYGPPDPVFPVVPTDFVPHDLGALELHREPTVIHGRVVHATSSGVTPLAGAAVRIVGVWRTLPPATAAPAADPANLIALQTPLRANRTVATDLVTRRTLAPTGSDKQLVESVPPGSTVIVLSDRIGLTRAGHVLYVDADAPDRSEHVRIAALPAASGSTGPVQVALTHPLANSHRSGARVLRVRVLAPPSGGAARQFATLALTGDTTLFFRDDVAGLEDVTDVHVRIGTGGTAEYHQLSVYSAVSDPQGYYRLPPLSRVAQLAVRATHGTLTAAEALFQPDYSLRENRLDLTFR